ncbi:hypothetical protein HBH98_015190 [Parastagonospora nodorum]|nr:hypothetical protein HBH53_008930 [Parastagonospora nodorum]KAH3956937.1 hypothetical protein HBH51_232650 [Parastagonospora nodorum]KAH3958596.1 hypothetical protein HBH52_250560 [Parastagonospora nodorum]KAH4058754.1 hypothetical protein HBH49_037220 [Parastagonospora nodorum]KAH4069415.1 hypothetical protein HBH50_112840 [Parastagonospora nodorum]
MEELTPTMRTFVEPHTSFEYEQFIGVPGTIHQFTTTSRAGHGSVQVTPLTPKGILRATTVLDTREAEVQTVSISRLHPGYNADIRTS